jgi:hypothetical protein
MGALYAATIFMCFNNCGTVFYREKAAGMYSAIPYALAQANLFLISLGVSIYVDIQANV